MDLSQFMNIALKEESGDGLDSRFDTEHKRMLRNADLILTCNPSLAEKYANLRTSGGFDTDESFLAVLLLNEERRQSTKSENFELIRCSETLCYILTKKAPGQTNLGLLVNVDSKLNANRPGKKLKDLKPEKKEFRPLQRNVKQVQMPPESPQLPPKRANAQDEYEASMYSAQCTPGRSMDRGSSMEVGVTEDGKSNFLKFKCSVVNKQVTQISNCSSLQNKLQNVTVLDYNTKTGKPRKCFLCIYCGRGVVKTSYAQHMTSHDMKRERNNIFKCVTCDAFFNTKENRMQHEVATHQAIIVNTKRWFYKCPDNLDCDKKHGTVSELHRHAALLSKRLGLDYNKEDDKCETFIKNFSGTLLPLFKPSYNFGRAHGCPLCATVLPDLNVMHQHIKQSHLTTNWDKCKLCKREEFITPEHLMPHVPKVWVCNTCNWSMGCEEGEGGEVPKHFCKTEVRPSYGNGYLTFMFDFQMHFKCTRCDTEFSSFDGFNRTGIYPHLLKSVHSDGSDAMYDSKSYEFNGKGDEEGVKPCTSKKKSCARRDMIPLKQDMPCEACGKKFSTLRRFKQHKIYCCQFFTCGVCNEKIKGYGNFYYHKKKHSVGKPEKKLQCTVCGFFCAVKRQLSDHMNMHSGHRPYQCEHCNARFKHISNWRSHLKLHQPERKHTCEFCGKGFTRLGIYKNHKATHTGECRFPCDYCGRKFNRKNKMAEHMKKDHSNVITIPDQQQHQQQQQQQHQHPPPQLHLPPPPQPQPLQHHPQQQQPQQHQLIVTHPNVPLAHSNAPLAHSNLVSHQNVVIHPSVAAHSNVAHLNVAAQNYVTLQQRYLGSYPHHNL